MTQDEIIRVVLAIAIGMVIFTVFRKPQDPSKMSNERGRKSAKLAMILFCFGAAFALLYMIMNADL